MTFNCASWNYDILLEIFSQKSYLKCNTYIKLMIELSNNMMKNKLV